NPKRQRSVDNLPLLCGLALILAACDSGRAQDTATGVAEESSAPNLVSENDTAIESMVIERDEDEDAAARTTAEGFDAEDLDEESLAAGEAALDLVARLEAEILLADLLDEELYDEAVPVAARIVEFTEEEFGEGVELGIALSNLAILQRRVGLLEESEANFVRSIDTIRAVEGPYHETVITPLVGLGINYRMRGEPFQAITVLEEARSVNRRVLGLLNEDQVDIIDHLSNTMIDMQRYGEADSLQLEALHLRERIYGEDSMEVLPAVYKFARWLRSAYRFDEERSQYLRAMSIIRENDEESSPAMIRALRETGNSFRVQKYPEGRGISALRRALEIAEAQPERDNRVIAEILVDIGDWNTAFSKVGPTGDEYRRAWDLLGTVADGERLRHEWFSDPDYVLRENPSNRGISSANEEGALPGNVLVRFDVTAEGRTINVRVVESVPPGLKDDSTARALNRSRFRPRMVDGELVATEGLARNFTFHYVPSE
ncbi:MAG TPA: tetratricopeptide repeat protein, partial [Gammaproteobacteria bacterium]